MLVLSLATLLATVAFLALLFGSNATKASWFEQALFFLSIFLSLWGVATLLGVFIRKIFRKRFAFNFFFPTTFRQGFLTSAIVLGGLAFKRFELLNWYSAAGILGVAIFLEFIFSQIFERRNL